MPIRFQVDPDFYDHPKTAGMSDAAFSLWVRAGSFSVAKLTDGFITEAVLVHTLRSDTQVADELVDRGLWRRSRGGYRFHQWSPRNLTKARVEEHNRAEAKRKREARHNKNGQVSGVASGTENCSEKNLNDQLINTSSSERENGANLASAQVRDQNVRPDVTRTPSGVPPESNTVGVGVGVVSFSGSVGGEGYLDLTRARNKPPQRPRCKQHQHIPDHDPGPPCHGCKAEREAAEQRKHDEHTAELAAGRSWRGAVETCPDCDENGWLETDHGLTQHHPRPGETHLRSVS